MSLFKKNLELLKKNDPELARITEETELPEDFKIISSKKGFPVLKIGNIHLHSPYNPIEEAKNWVHQYSSEIGDGKPIVLLGLGLGYNLIELLKQAESEVFIIEPSKEIFRTVMEQIDLQGLLGRVRFLINQDINNLFEELPFKYLKYKDKYDLNILKHNPSLKINQEYFEGFLRRFEALNASSEINLNILVVSPLYGGSYPISKYCVSALKRLGHRVDFLDNSPYYQTFKSLEDITHDKNRVAQMRTMYIQLMSEALFARALHIKPDLILMLAQSPLSLGLPSRLKEMNIPLAYWFVEDFREMTYWKDIAPLCDFFFTIQRGEFFEELKSIGVTNCYYLPLGCDPQVHKKVTLTEGERGKYQSDISFVGAGYYNRKNSLSQLIDFDLKVWGTEWDLNSPLGKCIQDEGKRIEPDDYNKIFNSSKINLNLHSSTYHQGVNPFGDFVNPRTFEIASAGGFQIVDYRSELSKFFKPEEELVCYRDIDELREKIKYYLNYPDKRERIARKSQERAVQEHTYENRMKEMIAFMIESAPQNFLKDSKKENKAVQTLLEEAGKGSELEEFLSRFEDREEIELSDIVSEIKKGEGDLSRVENIFLLMDSFVN